MRAVVFAHHVEFFFQSPRGFFPAQVVSGCHCDFGHNKAYLTYRSGQVNDQTCPVLFQLDFKNDGRVGQLVFRRFDR